MNTGWEDFKEGFWQGWDEGTRIYFLPVLVPYHFGRRRLRLLRRRLRRALLARASAWTGYSS
ncbi:hypothetical protein [Massilia sp. BJB1822]|uniref:hypothetical protein n=1 Tax=Massilia sp. BJB1822 TaxID=2744470 RepID=UPI00159481E3|nr:hypothetical protein [Massilia sp. BJB1822]NVD98762.1 hypothetical protein [Massilia sp. BJB1822]